MGELSDSTVTVLVTDGERSAPLWEREPVAVRAAVAPNLARLAQAIIRHHGHWVRTMGDGVRATVADASDAIAAALAAQCHAGWCPDRQEVGNGQPPSHW